jgi:hypothetical protein
MNVFVLLWWRAGPGFHRFWGDFVNVYKWYTRVVCVVFCRPGSIWENIQAARTDLQKDFDRFGERLRTAAKAGNAHLESAPENELSAAGVENLPAENTDTKGVATADFAARNDVENTSSSHKNRKILQKIFRTFSDTQAVTGISLLLAALIQGDCLSLYHTAIIIDLISISADGQAIMLFYAYRNFTIDTPFAPLRADRGIRVRLLSSALFLVLYFVFVFKEYFRYRDSEECFLYTTNGKNSGAWGIATAVLVLVVYFPIFLPRQYQEWSIKVGRIFTSRALAFFYHDDSSRIADPERERVPRKGPQEKLLVVLFGLRRILAWMIYAIGKVIQWLYHRELSFPIATWIYFIWNAIDIGLLKKTNTVLLAGGGDEEKIFGAFGQIVPIVMGAALAFPIYDVWQGMKITSVEILPLTSAIL